MKVDSTSLPSAKRVGSRERFSSSDRPELTITYTPPTQSPGITSHPQSTTINSGNTSNPINGATSLSFTTPALTQTTSYWARVTNIGGSVDSNTSTVTGTTPSNRQR